MKRVLAWAVVRRSDGSIKKAVYFQRFYIHSHRRSAKDFAIINGDRVVRIEIREVVAPKRARRSKKP